MAYEIPSTSTPAPAAPQTTTNAPAPGAISDVGTRISESGAAAPGVKINSETGDSLSVSQLVQTGIADIDAFLTAKNAAKEAGHNLTVYDYVNLVRKSLPQPSAEDLASEIASIPSAPLIKSGHLTTEFWLMAFAVVTIMLLAAAHVVNPSLAATLDTIASLVYMTERNKLKQLALNASTSATTTDAAH